MNRNRKFNRLIWIGMVFLAIGSILVLFLPELAVMPETWSHGVSDFFYGLAIACMVLGLRRKASSKCNSQLPPAA